MERIYRKEMESNIDALISCYAFAGKSIFLFGHCNATEETIDYLSERMIYAKAILDNNEAKQGFAYRDVPVRAPSYIQEFDGLCSTVLIATRFYDQMAAQLQRLGYDGEIVKVVEYSSFAEYSVLDDTFIRKKDRVSRGIEKLEEIRNQYPEQHLVVCSNDALGDVYWAMAFLPKYCEKHKIPKTVIVV